MTFDEWWATFPIKHGLSEEWKESVKTVAFLAWNAAIEAERDRRKQLRAWLDEANQEAT